MIKFSALIKAIHESIRTAAKEVEAQGAKHIETFFEEVPAEADSTVKGERITSQNSDKTIYRPITYSMEFPSRTPEGIESVVVEVPLITLTPISSPRVSEVTFSTELEISSDKDDELYVSFPSPSKSRGLFGRGDEGGLSNAKIEVTLKGSEPPEGLRKLIEGYERALRAQIPG